MASPVSGNGQLHAAHWRQLHEIYQYPDWHMQGLLGVTLSAGVPALHGLHAAVNQSAFFVAMLYIVAIGTGGSCAARVAV